MFRLPAPHFYGIGHSSGNDQSFASRRQETDLPIVHRLENGAVGSVILVGATREESVQVSSMPCDVGKVCLNRASATKSPEVLGWRLDIGAIPRHHHVFLSAGVAIEILHQLGLRTLVLTRSKVSRSIRLDRVLRSLQGTC